MTPCEKIFKNSFQKDSSRHRSRSCVQILGNLADRKSITRALFTSQKNTILAHSLAFASARIAPKICQCQRQRMYSQCPKFHPNLFTSGGVIAECVKTVQTCHKVFPILDEAIASCRVMMFSLHQQCQMLTSYHIWMAIMNKLVNHNHVRVNLNCEFM